MVIDDQEFGRLVQEVTDMHKWMKNLDTKVDNLLAAYNQAKGAAKCLSPFWNKAVNVIWILIGGGVFYAIQTALACKGGIP